MCRDALIWADVPSLLPGARLGDVGLSHSVGPASVAGAIIEYDASETMSPRCPKYPPPKWLSIALEFAYSNFRMAWIVL
jgi:hypothetical protein